MTPTLRDELMKMVEAAGKATPGIRYVSYDNYSDRIELGGQQRPIVIGRMAGDWPEEWQLNDYRFIAMCNVERIKALAEVAMVAEELTRMPDDGIRVFDAGERDRLSDRLARAVERLRKAVGT